MPFIDNNSWVIVALICTLVLMIGPIVHVSLSAFAALILAGLGFMKFGLAWQLFLLLYLSAVFFILWFANVRGWQLVRAKQDLSINANTSLQSEEHLKIASGPNFANSVDFSNAAPRDAVMKLPPLHLSLSRPTVGAQLLRAIAWVLYVSLGLILFSGIALLQFPYIPDDAIGVRMYVEAILAIAVWLYITIWFELRIDSGMIGYWYWRVGSIVFCVGFGGGLIYTMWVSSNAWLPHFRRW